jgi:hypothetical protein
VFGFLPDAFWPHLGYLGGLLLLAGVLLLAVPAWRSPQRPPLRPVLAVSVAGLVLVVASAARLVALPDRELVVGPAPSDRVAAGFRYQELSASPGPSLVYPQDGRARSCAGDAVMSVCVYPAYGQRLARLARQAMQPVLGLFAGLPGVPTRARMVPMVSQGSDLAACGDGEIQLNEVLGRYTSPSDTAAKIPYAEAYVRCALRGAGAVDDRNLDHDAANAQDAVNLWALLASGLVTRQQVERGLQSGGATFLLPSRASAQAALAMAAVPPGRVRAELAPLWERLRAGTLPLSELPGQRP